VKEKLVGEGEGVQLEPISMNGYLSIKEYREYLMIYRGPGSLAVV
jgi:hypothetical protein